MRSRLDEIRARVDAFQRAPTEHYVTYAHHAQTDLPLLLTVAEAATEYMKVSSPGGQDMARTLGERHWRRELRAALDALEMSDD